MALVERTDAVKDYLYFSRVPALIKEASDRRRSGAEFISCGDAAARAWFCRLPCCVFCACARLVSSPENHDRGPRKCKFAAQLVDHVHLAHVAAGSGIFQIGLEMQIQS